MITAGDCLSVMANMEPQSVDSIVTDPPYGLKFMGKEWDHGMPGVPFWQEALRVARPGAYLLAFGGTRTYHRLTCAIEDAGWEIRDCLMWLYGQGFPKGKACLKPAWEPVVMARAPGRAAHLQIDECRLPTNGERLGGGAEKRSSFAGKDGWDRPWMHDPDHQARHAEKIRRNVEHATALGRYPANLCLDEEAARMLDSEVGGLGRSSGTEVAGEACPNGRFGSRQKLARGQIGFGDSGGPSRFFYCAKASRREREAGLRGQIPCDESTCRGLDTRVHVKNGAQVLCRRNIHPTLKPVALMCWLCRLVTPPGGLILDPFAGSGSTGIAAAQEGFRFIGIEKEPEYAEIADARIAHVQPGLREAMA